MSSITSHVNVGTIGHIDHSKSSGDIIMGTTQKGSILSRAMAAIGSMFNNFFNIGVHASPQFRKGTPTKRSRKKGKVNPAGTKQARLVKERKLGLKNPGGMISEYYRERKQERMLHIQAEYGNCAGRLH